MLLAKNVDCNKFWQLNTTTSVKVLQMVEASTATDFETLVVAEKRHTRGDPVAKAKLTLERTNSRAEKYQAFKEFKPLTPRKPQKPKPLQTDAQKIKTNAQAKERMAKYRSTSILDGKPKRISSGVKLVDGVTTLIQKDHNEKEVDGVTTLIKDPHNEKEEDELLNDKSDDESVDLDEFTRIDVEQEALDRKNINLDAANYEDAVKSTLLFHTCAICEREEGLSSLVSLASCRVQIEASGISALFLKLVSPLSNPESTKYEKAYALAAATELTNGLLKGVEHVCKTCVGQLPRLDKFGNCMDATFSKVPKLALVNGYFRGKCPDVLRRLNHTELSLVCLIDLIYKLSLLPSGCHYYSHANVWGVFNNLAAIKSTLPVTPTLEQFAYIRYARDKLPKDLKYWPRKVLEALTWLEANNFLYEGKLILPRLPDGELDPNWRNGGLNEAVDPQCIIAEEGELDNLADVNASPVNTGTPLTTFIHLEVPEQPQSISERIASIAAGQSPTTIHTRSNGITAPDYKTPFFLQMSFAQLYPYGKGGPDNITSNVVFDSNYISHVLHMGGERLFQQTPSFIFYAYTWSMKKKVGSLCWNATKKEGVVGDESHTLTVREAQALIAQVSATSTNEEGAQFLNSINNRSLLTGPSSAPPVLSDKEVRKLLNRLQPYADSAQGTSAYMAKQRSNLLAMISSPVTTTNGQWRVFFTEAQSDMYLSDIYDNAITSVFGPLGVLFTCSLEDRRAAVDKLTVDQRNLILQDHPFLSARIHALHQDIFWRCILDGHHKPFGTISDFWRRVEFQLRGTPHSHNLIAVLKDGIEASSSTSGDLQELRKVKNYVKGISTAKLQPRDICESDNEDLPADEELANQQRIDETKYRFNVNIKSYFKDDKFPSRARFTTTNKDFWYNKRTGYIPNKIVRREYRRLQLANQMHSCRNSCFKFCKRGAKRECRYEFIKEIIPGNLDDPVIVEDRDKKSRARTRVMPQRNNGNLAVSSPNPLIALACRGNHDIQYINNTHGATEYVSKYASKADSAESTTAKNVIARKLSLASNYAPNGCLTLQMKLRAVSEAVMEAKQIGTVEACYILSKQSLVKSSRSTLHINTLKRKEVTTKILLTAGQMDDLPDKESAFSDSPTNQLNLRDAYHELVKYQIETFHSNNVDFFSFLSSYQRIDKVSSKKISAKTKIKEGVHHLQVDRSNGMITNAVTFTLRNLYYTASKRLCVIALSPPIPLDETDERSAYSTLLLHGNWANGESSLLGNCATAVERLGEVKESLPDYVKRSLEIKKRSQDLLANTGDPIADNQNCAADFDDWMRKYNEMEREQMAEEHGGDEGSEFQKLPSGFIINEVVRNIPVGRANTLAKYISKIKKDHFTQKSNRFCLTADERDYKALNPDTQYDIKHVELIRDELEAEVGHLNECQLKAYNIAVDHISSRAQKQMIMFLSGEGGTGKSTVIKAVVKYTRCLVGRTEGGLGAVCITAPTGGAAHNICGQTWQSALGKGMNQLAVEDMTYASLNTLERKIKGTVLFILDELSLTSCEQLHDISERLCAATGVKNKKFGGLHVLLAGDFFQMQCMGGTPLVQPVTNCAKLATRQGRETLTNHLTHYVQLEENCRAMSNNGVKSQLADLISKIRVGNTEIGVLEAFNANCLLDGIEAAMERPNAEKALWITSKHEKINKINKLFAQKMATNPDNPKLIYRIIAKHKSNQDDVPHPTEEDRNRLYGVTGGIAGRRTEHYPTHLDLMVGTRVRITKNLCVEVGLYNGKMGTVHSFLYTGPGPKTAEERKPKRPFAHLTDEQREIPIVLVQMDGDDESFPYSCSDEIPRLIPITPHSSPNGPICTFYTRKMLPIVIAHARTGHSVQGLTAYDGVVIDPGSEFFAGDYVALSRATRMERISLLSPLLARHFQVKLRYRKLVEEEYKRLKEKYLD